MAELSSWLRGLLPAVYEIVDERELPERARGEEGRMAWRLRTRHRLHASVRSDRAAGLASQ